MVLFQTLGPWTWVILGLILLGIEIFAPSTFLLWPGLSAIVVGVITLVLGTDSAIWPWQAQLLSFLLLTLIIAWFGRQYVSKQGLEESEQPDLNERGAKLIGQTAVLSNAISNGQGRVKIGDTTWRVKGPDSKAGSTVRVVDYDAGTLLVELV